MIDRADCLSRINRSEIPGQIEFGCGPTQGRPGHVTIDVLDYPTVNVVGDVFDALDALDPGVITKVYASHFVEHIDNVTELLHRLSRVCATGAVVEFVAPHFSNPYFYSDLTHKKPFGLYTFSYLTVDRTGMKRSVPNYQNMPSFDLMSAHLGFRSYRPNYIRHGVKKVIEKLVNLSNFTRELHEEVFTWLIPCYEVTYRLVRRDDAAGLPHT